ncbi:MAG: hypothetical protein KBT11_11875, partial [Treponema sp.]|nr:hypothetical protein [Candidatus Treponema equifaecale]
MNKETNTFDDFQPWETITLSNRYMFYKIFTHYPDKLHRLLEILLKIKIDHITPPEGEKNFETDPTAKSIRLDVHTKDKNRVYTVEMQNATESDLPKRA